jgi:chaperonin GroEL (HSP60 family)
MLDDKDRIFTNLYGFDDRSLAGARRRGIGTGRRSCSRGAATPSWTRSRPRACAAAAGPVFRPG